MGANKQRIAVKGKEELIDLPPYSQRPEQNKSGRPQEVESNQLPEPLSGQVSGLAVKGVDYSTGESMRLRFGWGCSCGPGRDSDCSLDANCYKIKP